MNIYIDVKNRVATYRSCGTDPVCGSNADQYKFAFDSEWESINPKTARFIWGEKYFDVEFEGDTCPAPLFENVSRVLVGVYAGEPAAEEASLSTTKAEVPYGLSVRCGYHSPRAESGGSYTNEAKGYAAEAREAVKLANEITEEAIEMSLQTKEMQKEIVDSVKEAYGMTEVGRISFPMIFEEQYDEEIGWYVYPWGLQDRLIDYRNGSFLLYAYDEAEETPADFPGYEMIMRLMKCPLCRVVITAPNVGDVLYHTELYDAPADGEHWEVISFAHSSSVSDWTLPYSEWITGGVRMVTYDNQYAPSTECGPRAAFLRFPKEIKDALAAHTFSPGNPYEVATMTFIGYR